MNHNEMKNHHTRFATLMASVILFFLAALTASAQSATAEAKGIKYSLLYTNHTAYVSGVKDRYIAEAEISDSVVNDRGEYFKVTAIGDNAFNNCTSLKHVYFNESLTKIGNSAFYGCIALTEVIVPEGVTTIEADAFKNCSTLARVELPSTLTALTTGCFYTKSIKELVFKTVNYDESGELSGLPFFSGAFNNIKSTCTLIVPKKAEQWYRENWSRYFTNIETFGTAPDGYTVLPAGVITDYTQLSSVKVQFRFSDPNLTNNVTLADDGALFATLTLSDGTVIGVGASSISAVDNALTIDFSTVLPQYKEHFVAKTEAEKSIVATLSLHGNVLVEGCNFSLDDYFGGRRIAWDVPLLPSVYDLTTMPKVTVDGAADAHGYFSYEAFKAVTLTFEDFNSVSLDPTTGAYMKATLMLNGQELDVVTTEAKAEGNTIVIPFDVPLERLLVRKSSGTDYYVFSMNFEAQVRLSDGKNYRFTMRPRACNVKAEYYPEPTGFACSPVEGKAELTDLSLIELTFDGVEAIELLDDASAQPFAAQLRLEGYDLFNIQRSKVRTEGNKMFLPVEGLYPGLVTLISSKKDIVYNFSLALAADLLTDGYPCRIVVGEPTLPPVTDTTASNRLYTLGFGAPVWTVDAIVEDVPVVTVSTPLAGPNGPWQWEDLKSIVLTVENYQDVRTVPTFDGQVSSATTVGKIVRYGNPVAVVSSVTTEGNQIFIDFSESLNYSAVGITPDDDPNEPVELTFQFEGDLVFDGLPYHLVVNGYNEDLIWRLQPIIVYKLPTPTIEYADNRIYFTSGVEGVDYHYTISNVDTITETTTVATKGTSGSSLLIPLQKRYEISVYASREGYEDSDVATATLVLDNTPVITTKK